MHIPSVYVLHVVLEKLRRDAKDVVVVAERQFGLVCPCRFDSRTTLTLLDSTPASGLALLLLVVASLALPPPHLAKREPVQPQGHAKNKKDRSLGCSNRARVAAAASN